MHTKLSSLCIGYATYFTIKDKVAYALYVYAKNSVHLLRQ